MADGDHIDSDAIAELIAEYISCRPQAADSISGIRQWWLAGKANNVSFECVQQAVDKLMQKEILRSEVNSSGEVIYLSFDIHENKNT